VSKSSPIANNIDHPRENTTAVAKETVAKKNEAAHSYKSHGYCGECGLALADELAINTLFTAASTPTTINANLNAPTNSCVSMLLSELHLCERCTAKQAVGVRQRLDYLEMIIALRDEQLDRFACSLYRCVEVVCLPLELWRFASAVRE
jgi:hypothetical protein